MMCCFPFFSFQLDEERREKRGAEIIPYRIGAVVSSSSPLVQSPTFMHLDGSDKGGKPRFVIFFLCNLF